MCKLCKILSSPTNIYSIKMFHKTNSFCRFCRGEWILCKLRATIAIYHIWMHSLSAYFIGFFFYSIYRYGVLYAPCVIKGKLGMLRQKVKKRHIISFIYWADLICLMKITTKKKVCRAKGCRCRIQLLYVKYSSVH